MSKKDIEVGKITISINSLINLGLKATFGVIPDIFNAILPKWKRHRIINKLKGIKDPEPPSVEDILK